MTAEELRTQFEARGVHVSPSGLLHAAQVARILDKSAWTDPAPPGARNCCWSHISGDGRPMGGDPIPSVANVAFRVPYPRITGDSRR
jgi:hypothetical protein